MSEYGRDAEEIKLEIADAVGNGEGVVEHFRRLARARGWSRGGE